MHCHLFSGKGCGGEESRTQIRQCSEPCIRLSALLIPDFVVCSRWLCSPCYEMKACEFFIPTAGYTKSCVILFVLVFLFWDLGARDETQSLRVVDKHWATSQAARSLFSLVLLASLFSFKKAFYKYYTFRSISLIYICFVLAIVVHC